MTTEQRRSGADGARRPEHILVVFPGYHRSWAAWIGQCLERHGHPPPRSAGTRRARSPWRTRSAATCSCPAGRVLLVSTTGSSNSACAPRASGTTCCAVSSPRTPTASRPSTSPTRPLHCRATAVLEPASLWGIGRGGRAEERLLTRLEPEPPAHPAHPGHPGALPGHPLRRLGRGTAPQSALHRTRRPRSPPCTSASPTPSAGPPSAPARHVRHRQDPARDRVRAPFQHRLRRRLVGQLRRPQHPARPLRRTRGRTRAAQRKRTGRGASDAVRNALRRGDPHAKWLIVFDGWDDTAGADTLLPQDAGHVLVTSPQPRVERAGRGPGGAGLRARRVRRLPDAPGRPHHRRGGRRGRRRVRRRTAAAGAGGLLARRVPDGGARVPADGARAPALHRGRARDRRGVPAVLHDLVVDTAQPAAPGAARRPSTSSACAPRSRPAAFRSGSSAPTRTPTSPRSCGG